MKATEQCSPVALFIMPQKVVLTFKSVSEILKCGHSNELGECEEGGFWYFQVANLWHPEKAFEQFDGSFFSTRKSVCLVKLCRTKTQ